MTVYVVQARLWKDKETGVTQVFGPNSQDLRPAAKFGKLFSLLPPGQVTFSVGPTVARLNKILQEYTDDHYLLLIGDPLAIGMAMAIAGKWNRGKVNVLKWDRQEGKYYPLAIDLNTGVSEHLVEETHYA